MALLTIIPKGLIAKASVRFPENIAPTDRVVPHEGQGNPVRFLIMQTE